MTRCPHCLTPSTSPLPDSSHVNCGTGLTPIPKRVTAAMLIAEYATTHDVLSSNDLCSAFEFWGVTEMSRGPAFAAAVRAGLIRKAGHVPSTDAATKKHDVSTYQSLITREAMEERRVA